MTDDDLASDAEAVATSPADDAGDDLDGAAEPSKRGNRRRRKLARLLDADTELSEQIDLMLGKDEQGRHRFSFRGGQISTEGGPAKEVFGLADRLLKSFEKVFPEANPFVDLLAPVNSIQVSLYAPESEVKEAELRRRKMDDEDPGAIGLPDTSLAVLSLGSVFAHEDPAEAAKTARLLGVTSSKAISDLAAILGDAGVELDLLDVADETIKVTPEQAIRLVEQLDKEAELPPVKVKVAGVLQGVNSGGDGEFEIVTDESIPLDPALGSRKKAGDKIHGALSPTARKQIKDGSLWDTHVEAEVQVVRTERAGSRRVEGIRLLSVKPRFH